MKKTKQNLPIKFRLLLSFCEKISSHCETKKKFSPTNKKKKKVGSLRTLTDGSTKVPQQMTPRSTDSTHSIHCGRKGKGSKFTRQDGSALCLVSDIGKVRREKK